MAPQPSNEPQGVETYFTGVEELRDIFSRRVAAPTLDKRLLIIHGVGGVGKSSLVRMFRLHCKSGHVPVALASGDVAKSATEILKRWADDLLGDGLGSRTFSRTYDRYRTMIAKVEDRADDLTKNVAKTLAKSVIDAIPIPIPGIGSVLSKLGGMGAEALVDWLRAQGFAKPDIDLVLDPAKRLTDDLLADIGAIAPTRRIVFMLDTYEKISSLEDWVRSFAERCHPNVLLVISGRGIPNWDRDWSGWLAQADVQELKPMELEVASLLVRRYYATLTHSELAPDQAGGIVRFARGLPIAITSAVDLMVKFKARDFQAITPMVINDLAKRLQEDVPAEFRPALQAAAILRWFDEPVLRAVMQKHDVSADFQELQRFPFVVLHEGRFALHDVVRDTLDANLRSRDSERHRELHQRAVSYFEKQLEKCRGEEAVHLSLERLYHRIRIDEDTGIKLFQSAAEELVSYRLVNRLRVLLNDVSSYVLDQENSSLWRRYYIGRLNHWEGHFNEAERLYQEISENEQAEPRLQAYALCDLGYFATRNERSAELGGINRARGLLERSLRIAPHMDRKLIFVLSHLADTSLKIGEWEKAIDFFEQQLRFFQEENDNEGIAYTLMSLRIAYGGAGLWRKSEDAYLHSCHALQGTDKNSFISKMVMGFFPWHLLWTGRYFQAEQITRETLDYSREVGDADHIPLLLKDLGLAFGLQGRWAESETCYAECLKLYHQRGEEWSFDIGIAHGCYGKVLTRQGELKRAETILALSLAAKEKNKDDIGIPEVLCWLGELDELKLLQSGSEMQESQVACSYYWQVSDYRWTGRHYWVCAALVGRMRTELRRRNFTAIAPLLADAEQLARQYEYNDLLASLQLTGGHLALETECSVTSSLQYYQHALIYALRFNRFLLDEVLSGRPQGTPHQSIIPYLMGYGQEGRKILVSLREWWCSEKNDIGAPRPDTISPIPEDISLLEAERMARKREPGDGSPQNRVVEQIDLALGAR